MATKTITLTLPAHPVRWMIITMVLLIAPLPFVWAFPPHYPGAERMSAYVNLAEGILVFRLIVAMITHTRRWTFFGAALVMLFVARALTVAFVAGYLYWPAVYGVDWIRYPLRFVILAAVVAVSFALSWRPADDAVRRRRPAIEIAEWEAASATATAVLTEAIAADARLGTDGQEARGEDGEDAPVERDELTGVMHPIVDTTKGGL